MATQPSSLNTSEKLEGKQLFSNIFTIVNHYDNALLHYLSLYNKYFHLLILAT